MERSYLRVIRVIGIFVLNIVYRELPVNYSSSTGPAGPPIINNKKILLSLNIKF